MHFFFLTLVTISTGLLGSTFFFSGLLEDLHMHAFFGLIATVSVFVVHCWVFFYFIGTGEGIREGIIENRLDAAAIKRTKKFKGKTFPFALFSMIFMIVATVLGAGVRVGDVASGWHFSMAYFAIAFNLFTFYQESKVIRENEVLMKELNAQID